MCANFQDAWRLTLGITGVAQQSLAVLVSSNETVRQIPDRVGLQTRRSQRWSPTTSSHNWIKDERDR